MIERYHRIGSLLLVATLTAVSCGAQASTTAAREADSTTTSASTVPGNVEATEEDARAVAEEPATSIGLEGGARAAGCRSAEILRPTSNEFADAFAFWGRWQAAGRLELVQLDTPADLRKESDLLVIGCLTGQTTFLDPEETDEPFRVPDYLVVDVQVVEVLHHGSEVDRVPDIIKLPISVEGEDEAKAISQRLHQGIVLLGLFDGRAGLEQLGSAAQAAFPADSFGVLGSQAIWIPTVDGFRSPPRELTSLFGFLEPPACLNDRDHRDIYPPSLHEQLAPEDLEQRIHEQQHSVDETPADHAHGNGADHEHEMREEKPIADEFCGVPVDEVLEQLRTP